MAPDNVEALVLSVNQTVQTLTDELEDTRVSLDGIHERLKGYVPRREVEERAERVKKVGIMAGSAISVCFMIGGGLWYDNRQDTNKLTQNCVENRQTIKQMIEIAIADRQPLSSSTPETIAAIEEVNQRQVRPLRERLLSLEGAQPEKC